MFLEVAKPQFRLAFLGLPAGPESAGSFFLGLVRVPFIQSFRAVKTFGTDLQGVAMTVIADLCVVPLGVGVSVSKYVVACEKVLKEAGLKTTLHAYGTNIEGEWDEVFAAIKRCHEIVHELGAPRITSTLKFGTRTDRAQTMQDKIDSVEKKM